MKRLLAWLRKRSSATEAKTAYNGVFSYAGEFHAFILGLGAGAAAAVANAPMVAASLILVALGVRGASALAERFRGSGVVAEVRREPWYAIGGDVLGYVLAAWYLGLEVATTLP